MKLKQFIQPLYNNLRIGRVFGNFVNFFETREREFRRAREQAVQKALASTADGESSCFTTGGGIFRGLRWPRMVYVGSVFAPKVLGTYEVEIQPVFARLAKGIGISSFIDIGAAEGYYAVGAALLNPTLKVIAFERQTAAHEHIAELAAENSVLERIELHGEFDLAKLDKKVLGERPLVLMDVEGAEAELIDARFAGCFAKASLIVEVHDFAVPGVARTVESVLSRTHKITDVRISRSVRGALRNGTGLSRFEWQVATNEKRPIGNHWLIAIPRDTV